MPRLFPVSRWPLLVALAVVFAFSGLAARPAQAQDPIEYPDLVSNPAVRAERIAMLREEFRERQRENKEAAERARKHKKSHGKQIELRPIDLDYVGISPQAMREAQSNGIHSVLVAPTNAKCNDKTADAAGAGQAEQSVAFLGLNGLCSWNDGQGFNLSPQDVQGYGYTVDGGVTWIDGGIPPKSGTISTWTSDPVTTVNEKTGEFYYCGLTSNTGTQNGVAVARGHFAGGAFVWDGTSQVAVGSSSSYAYDKEWMCADSLTGNLYVTWTLFTTTTGYIQYSRSTDGGLTWSAPVQVSGSWENGAVSGSRPVVGPNGEVYITYTAIGTVDADSVKVMKSTNNGVTWGPSVVGMTCMDAYFNGAPGFNRGRAVTFASLAVDRSLGTNRGRAYLAIQNSVNFYLDQFSALTAANAKAEVEVNGNFANASPFTIGQNLHGALSTTTDVDNWKFTGTQGTTYIFYADSVRTSTFKYTMRLYCPKDTSAVSRLAMSSDGSSSSSVNVHAMIVWTCPETNTYYLRMQYSTSTGGYRIRTYTHTTRASDIGRDVRDATVASSANGVTGWSAPVIVNDDPARYDNWLPEVAVPSDGYAYAMWFDWRDTPASCFGGSNIYMTRSLNGGTTWAANQKATDVVTPNWTQTSSNIAPNQGDYNSMYGGDCIGIAMSDGRLGDPDIYAARLLHTFTAACGADAQTPLGVPFNFADQLTNASVMFPCTVNYTLTADRAWPGLPVTGSTTVPAGSVGSLPFSVNVPDTAANGIVHLCLTTTLPNGALSSSCCLNLTVYDEGVATLAALVNASAAAGQVHLQWELGVPASATLYRSSAGQAWERIASLSPDGSNRISYVDEAVTVGQRYGYRLGLLIDGQEVMAGETWVDVPLEAVLSLQGMRPNPANGPLTVSFSLPNSRPARLELVDVTGRRVFDQQVGGFGPGTHVVRLDASLPAGIYAVRLTQGDRTLTTKATIVR
jgi:hypothetical protein